LGVQSVSPFSVGVRPLRLRKLFEIPIQGEVKRIERK
jgi:hypothetical protein